MSCNFHIGQKVAATEDLEFGVNRGDVFTIASIETGTFKAYDGVRDGVSLGFMEISTRPAFNGFDGRFFRPIVERKTDISVFTAMLTESKQTVTA